MSKKERTPTKKVPWNRGKLVGQKLPLTQQQVWSIRMRLEAAEKVRDLALLNLAIDSKLRACDLLKLKVSDVSSGEKISSRAMVVQQKTGRPVRFELTPRTRESVQAWIREAKLVLSDFLFPSRIRASLHLSTRQYTEAWTEALRVDEIRELLAGAAITPEGLACLDRRTEGKAPLVAELDKLKEVNDKAVALAQRLINLLDDVYAVAGGKATPPSPS